MISGFGLDIIIAFWTGLDFIQVASEEEIAGMAFSERSRGKWR